MTETTTSYESQKKRKGSHQNNVGSSNNSLGTIMLTNRKQLIELIQNNDRLHEVIGYFFCMSLLFITVYGMCLGVHSGFFLQTISSGIKAPILFYFTLTSNSYEFTSVLNIIICMIAGSCGVYMLWKEMNHFSSACEGSFMKSMLHIW